MIGWALRIILILIVLRLVLRFVIGLLQGLAPDSQPRQSAARRPVALVRDPVCGTHIPRDRAIAMGSGDHMLFFCSDKCRQAYRTAH
jgi:YHS domain-containing protein